MSGDRYLKVVLTVIAVELLWIGVKDMSPAVSAQARPVATPVVITGIDIPRDSPFLPVGVAGTYIMMPDSYRNQLEPVEVRVSGRVDVATQNPVRITADRPLKIEADRPLRVENVPYTPGLQPGE